MREREKVQYFFRPLFFPQFSFSSLLSHPPKGKKMGDPGEDRTHGLQISTFERGRRGGGAAEGGERGEEGRTTTTTSRVSCFSLFSLFPPKLPPSPPRLLLFSLVRSLMLYPTELRGRFSRDNKVSSAFPPPFHPRQWRAGVRSNLFIPFCLSPSFSCANFLFPRVYESLVSGGEKRERKEKELSGKGKKKKQKKWLSITFEDCRSLPLLSRPSLPLSLTFSPLFFSLRRHEE